VAESPVDFANFSLQRRITAAAYGAPGLELNFSAYASRLQQITIRGVQTSHADESLYVAADPGAVVLDAYSQSFQIFSDAKLTLENLTLQNIEDAPGRPHESVFNLSGDVNVILNCQFFNVRAEGNLPDPDAAIFHVFGAPDQPSTFRVENSLFVSCQADGASLLYSGHCRSYFENCTLYRCGSADGGVPRLYGMTGTNLELTNNIFSHNPANQELYHGFDVRIDHCVMDAAEWASAQPEILSGQGNIILQSNEVSDFVRYVNGEAPNYDLRLRYDSQCLDVGDPSLQDFDLTRSDIGWMPNYAEREISGSLRDPLPVGFYKIVGDATLVFPISAGTILRAGSGIHLEISNPPGGAGLHVGSLFGPRTALVGRTSREAVSAETISFTASGLGLVGLHLEGVLFNYPPRRGTNANLLFDGWDFETLGQPFDAEHVSFQNYLNVPVGGLGANTIFHGALRFTHCQGPLRGFDFGNTLANNGPQKLSLFQSNMQVEECHFMWLGDLPLRDWPYLAAVGPQTQGEVALSDNEFTQDLAIKPMLDLTEAVVVMRRNQLQGCRSTPLLQTHASVIMAHEARNNFRSVPELTQSYPLIQMEAGCLDLYCGRNNFVLQQETDFEPFISYASTHGDTLPTPQAWRENFWGHRCAMGLSEAHMNDPDLALIPSWAFVEANLAECLEVVDPVNPACPIESNDPIELLNLGREAEASRDFALAQSLYRHILMQNPLSKPANEAGLRLKALGLNAEHGSEFYASIRSDLLAASVVSEGVKAHLQALLQRCEAYCVEARWGDRAVAIATLQGLYAQETNRLCLDTLTRSLLEIDTYPPQGAMMGSGPDVLLAQRLHFHEAIQDLFDYKRGHSGLTNEQAFLPASFAIRRIFPNPFNPRTNIEVDLPEAGFVKLHVYNMLDQCVSTLVDTHLEAGSHRVLFDGSRQASGVYFVVAQSATHSRVKKILLLK
jgi:hypothetical protein